MKKLLLLLLVASSLQAQQAQEKADEVVIGHNFAKIAILMTIM